MPTYDYKCPKCGTTFERFQKITAPPELKCPKCGATARRLIGGGAGLIFKGSGFYETDYKRAGQKKPQDEGGAPGGEGGEKPAPPKPESKPAKPEAD